MKRLLIPFAAALLAAASGTSALSVSQAKTVAAEAQAKAKVVHDSLERIAADSTKRVAEAKRVADSTATDSLMSAAAPATAPAAAPTAKAAPAPAAAKTSAAKTSVAKTSVATAPSNKKTPAPAPDAKHPAPSLLAGPLQTGDAVLPSGRLSKIFANMSAKDAAKVLAHLDDADVSRILGAVTDKRAAEIMALLPSERAAAISKSALKSPPGTK